MRVGWLAPAVCKTVNGAHSPPPTPPRDDVPRSTSWSGEGQILQEGSGASPHSPLGRKPPLPLKSTSSCKPTACRGRGRGGGCTASDLLAAGIIRRVHGVFAN